MWIILDIKREKNICFFLFGSEMEFCDEMMAVTRLRSTAPSRNYSIRTIPSCSRLPLCDCHLKHPKRDHWSFPPTTDFRRNHPLLLSNNIAAVEKALVFASGKMVITRYRCVHYSWSSVVTDFFLFSTFRSEKRFIRLSKKFRLFSNHFII